MAKKKTNNYITNKDLYTQMIHYGNEVKEAVRNNKDPPSIPKYIGEAIILISTNLAKKPNFSGYTLQYKQEMISDAILDCIAAVNNFDPDRTNNPFAYFTQIIWNAYIRRIQKEKKQQYIKLKNLESILVLGTCSEEEAVQFKLNDMSNEIIKSYEEKNLQDKLTNMTKRDKKLLINED